jgi:hypothetical protein
MSVARCLEINARLRTAGITVREVGGWQDRGNGQVSAYEGGLIHHTASGFGVALPGTGIGNLLINGRDDLAGPLCNYAGNDDGSVTVIAAHPANHAGASGGRSMGPLPITTLFNRRVLGLEIVYPGTEPMLGVQYRTAVVWGRVVADVVGRGDFERIRAHAETSITGKWDPGFAPGKTYNMAEYRDAVRVVGTTVEEIEEMASNVVLMRGDVSAHTYAVKLDPELQTAEGEPTSAIRCYIPGPIGPALIKAWGPVLMVPQASLDAIAKVPGSEQ